MDAASATDNFASFLLSLSHDPITLLSVFFLTIARILPIVTVAPFLGAKNLPAIVKMMFSVALCAIFLPQNLALLKTSIPHDLLFLGYCAKELIIGLFLGFFAAAPFFIAQTAGTLIDHSRGSSSLQVTDPTTQSQTSPVGILYNYVLLALFFSLDGPLVFFDALARSYQVIPVDQFVPSVFFTMKNGVWQQVFGLGQQIMRLAIQLAAPALIGILLIDLFLGIANRLAPQVQIVFLGIPLKSWVGLALMTAAWGLVFQVMGKESIGWMKMIQNYLMHAAA